VDVVDALVGLQEVDGQLRVSAGRRLWLFFAVALIGSMSCSGRASEDSLAAPASEIDMPLWGYLSAQGRTQASLDDAITREQINCMADKGLRFEPSVGIEAAAVVDPRRRYGVFDVASASSLGYLASAQTEVVEKSPAEVGFPPGGQELVVYNLALFGDGPATEEVSVVAGGPTEHVELFGGCIGEASTSVFGTRQNWLDYVATVQALGELDVGSFVALAGSAEFAAINEDWAACMLANDIENFRTPFDAMNFDWPEPRPGTRERAVAQQDAECKAQTEFLRRAASIEAHWQSGHPELEGLLLQFEQMRQDLTEGQ